MMKPPIELIRERANIVRAMPQAFMQTIADDLEKLLRAHEVMRKACEKMKTYPCELVGPCHSCDSKQALEAADKIMCEEMVANEVVNKSDVVNTVVNECIACELSGSDEAAYMAEGCPACTCVKLKSQSNIQETISNEDPDIQHHSSKEGYERVNHWINAPKEE